MMGYETQLKDSQGNDVYPITMGKLVYMNDGKTLQENISNNTEITQKMIDVSVNECATKQLTNVDSKILLNTGVSAGLASVPYVNNMFGIGEQFNVPIQFGANTIKNTGKTAMFPEIEFTGRHYVNLLGRDGNCEDASKWLDFQNTHTLDSVNKVFGSSGIKITLTSDSGCLHKPNMFCTGKYYFASAYIKNGNVSYVALDKDDVGGGKYTCSSHILDAAHFIRVGMKLQPSDINIANNLRILIVGVTGQYAYCDGIMLNEITPVEYNSLSDEQLLAKYPYVDGYGALTNPYFENRKYNLVRNGNCEEGVGYWTINCSIVKVVNGFFEITSAAPYGQIIQKFQVNQSDNYVLSCLAYKGTSESANLTVNYFDKNDVFISSEFIWTSSLTPERLLKQLTIPNNTLTVTVVPSTGAKLGTTYFKEIMLGSTVEYKSCEIERFCLEGQFTDDDKVIIKDGQVSGLLNWKHKTLYGKDYFTAYSTHNSTGGKWIYLQLKTDIPKIPNAQFNLVKYDDKNIPYMSGNWNIDKNDLMDYNHDLYQVTISVANFDSGWADNLQPNADDVKAYMNGWKALNNDGARYLGWLSVIDGSVPLGAIATTITSSSGTLTTFTVADASKFVVNDQVMTVNTSGTLADYGYITIISGNQITVHVPFTIVAGLQLVKRDKTGTTTSMLNYCKNNLAPNYNGYQLHYKLANPEPITDINVPIKGKIWSISAGDNYVTVDSGMVLGEIAKPVKGKDNLYRINNNYSSSYFGESFLQNKNEFIDNIYKNGTFDNKTWTWTKTSYDVVYGNYGLFTTLDNSKDFDPDATYTADYQILKTLHVQTFGYLRMCYNKDIFSAINTISNAIENKQQQNNALNTIVASSVYEEVEFPYYGIYTTPMYDYRGVLIAIHILFKVRKNIVPKLTIKSITIGCGGGIFTQKFKLNDIIVTKTDANLYLSSLDDNTISAFKASGAAWVVVDIIADCRGRI